MDENNLPRKTRWGRPKSSRSDPHLVEERGRMATSQDPSSLLPSRNGSRGRFSGLVPKLFGKVTQRFTRSARQSPNPEPMAASSSLQDIQPAQSIKVISASTLEPNLEQSSNSRIAVVSSTNEAEHLDPKFVNERIINATKGLAGIGQVSTIVQHTFSAANDLQSVSGTVDTFSTLLGPLKVFNSVANEIANIHPYAKVALSIFTCASKMILDQADRDVAVSGLLSKISEVYTFITEKEELAKIQSMLAIYGKIARQTLECADFITHYSETKSAWKRLGKHVASETDGTIQSYSEALDGLMQQFRDQVARDAAIILHRAVEDLDFSGMVYADGASFNTFKRCLPGTREDILSKIKSWVCSTEENIPRLLWLSGTAGKGKSAIAHTIASWSIEQGGLGACFCFDRTRGADRHHEKIFTTIARDLADCNPTMRRALARGVHDRNELRHTADIARQWQELVVGPIDEASKAIDAPVLVVIDALDESGDEKSREQILRLFAGDRNTTSSKLSQLPANLRIIITSRPLEDIGDALHTASHVHISIDDAPADSTEHDIQLYISAMLKGPRNTFDDGHFKKLAEKSDGLFEWARLACEHIKGRNRVGPDPMERFEAVVAGASAKGTRLLDDMYRRILAEIMPEDDREDTIYLYRSVMGQVLGSLEPLPMDALAALRLHFSSRTSRYKVDRVVGPLGSLLTGTTDSQTPIRPLHASFYDFLTDKSRSHDFFVDVSSVQSDLAFASLRVMEGGLRFNICSLESSYLPNSSVPELEKRVKDSISTELSYSCRFWGTHVAAMSFDSSLAKEVEAFFDGEHLLWWLEALALMKSLSGSAVTLSSIADWFLGHAEFTHVSNATRDTLRFVRTFAATILRSTPHLYLSALPFAPMKSRMFRKLASKFPCTPRIVAGHVENWPQMEKILQATDSVCSVAMSPDRKCIACGLYNGTIQVWDTETGEELGAPLQGHTRAVTSVAFFPGGHRIVSGSSDNTVRVWDAQTGEALGSPIQSHRACVSSVAVSPDGKRIVSGSDDWTIQVWDMETGEAFRAPIRTFLIGVLCVTISPDGKRIVSGSKDKEIRVWDMETGGQPYAPLQGHTSCVNSVAISPDGKYIVSGSDDMTIRVWDMESGEVLGTPLQGHTGYVKSVAILSDGNRIVSGSSDHTIRVWDAKTGVALGNPLQGHTCGVSSVAISSDGSRIVSGSIDETIRVWDADTITGKASVAALQSHTDSVNSIAISPDGHRIVSGSRDKTVQVWDIETGQALLAPLQGHTGSVQSVAISLDGKGIVSSSHDQTVRIWSAETGEASGFSLRYGGSGSLYSVAISPDGTRVVSSLSNVIHVCDLGTREAYGTREVFGNPLKGHSSMVMSIAISPDGKHIVSGSTDNTIWVWNAETGMASGAPLEGHSGWVESVAVSPDAKCVVSGSRDTTVRVWDIRTGKTLGAPLRGHTDYVCSVAISRNGYHIVSGSYDKTIRVWDMKTGEAVGAPFRGHSGHVLSVAISPDGKHIVSGSEDKTIRVWDLEFVNRHQPFETICFSSDPIHALHSSSSFLQDSETPAPSGPNEEGWVVGPEGRLLLWIPPIFHPVTYAQGNVLVIPNNNALQLDLSRVSHGTSWHECREQ